MNFRSLLRIFCQNLTHRVCFGIKIRQFLISGRLPCPMVRGMADTVKVQSDLDPLEGIDSLRLENEMKNYQQWMDERTAVSYTHLTLPTKA